MTQVDFLTDPRKITALLVNCRITDEAIYCGIAAFRGGIGNSLVVTDGIREWEVVVPPEVARVATWISFTDKNDNFMVKHYAKEK